MNIYPAIDILNGKCVRLYQGDYQRETIYSDDLNKIAKKYVSEGAKWLHVVDLDGAKNPNKNKTSLILDIVKTSGISIQIGGGIRSKSQIKNLLTQGANRIIVGSIAVTNQAEATEWFNYFGSDRIVLALDVMEVNQQYKVATHAWQQLSDYSIDDLINYYKTVGLKHLLCTNISLDGTLSSPDYALYDALLKKYPFLKLQASGGIQSLSDITTLREKKLDGAIIGRALYEEKFTLSEALLC